MADTDVLNALSEKIAALRSKEAEASLVKRGITAELEIAETQMLELLQASDLKSYRSPHGLCSISFRTSVKTPKTPEDRERFFAFLKEAGVYDQMIGVNSQTLNAFYKDRLEVAKEMGMDDFEVPGITEVTINPILSFTRPK